MKILLLAVEFCIRQLHLSQLLFSCFLVSSKSIVTVSKVYRNVSASHFNPALDLLGGPSAGPSRIKWTSEANIQIVKYLDSGRFSNVFEGIVDTTPVVLKVLKPTFMSKVKRELKMLQMVQGIPGIIKLYGATKNVDCRTVSLIFEIIGTDTQWLSHRAVPLTSYEVQRYCFKMLKALDCCHSKGVMHRDIKPRNVLYDRRSGEVRIIDFGLSDVYTAGKQYNPSVASRHYKCPELLCEFLYYDYSIDIWSAGCILAGLIFDVDPFFNGVDTLDQLQRIASTLGSSAIHKWVEKFQIQLSADMRKAIGSYEAKSLSKFVNKDNCNLCPPDAVDLAQKMLTVDHQDRLTAAECLLHPYFDNVRHLGI